jgi:hypothetical protein
MADVAQDEPVVATEGTADTEGVNNEPDDEAIIAPLEVVTAETVANDEDMATADTMQDISDWEKDENDVSDIGISDWENDDDASSQAGESDTNPSEHQDFEDDSIAQDTSEPTPETEKPTDQQEPEVVDQVQQIDTAASVPPTDVVVEDDAVPNGVTEDEQSTGDTYTALEPEASEQNDATQRGPDETQDEEPSTSDPTAELSEPPETVSEAHETAIDQEPIQVEVDSPSQDDTGDAKPTTGSQEVVDTADNVPTPQVPDTSISQPDASEENTISDSGTDAPEDATVHESPADEMEPAVNGEAAKDSEQVIVSATPDDVENPDACTGTYMLCFLCFTSLCRTCTSFRWLNYARFHDSAPFRRRIGLASSGENAPLDAPYFPLAHLPAHSADFLPPLRLAYRHVEVCLSP